MSVRKELIVEYLEKLPEVCNGEEIMYAVQLLEDLDAAEDDARKSRFVEHKFVAEEAEKWLNR